MSEEYRVVKDKKYDYYTICKVYTNGNGVFFTAPAIPRGKTFEELRGDVRKMFVDAFGKPVLGEDDEIKI